MAKFDLKGILSQESRKEMEIPEQKVVYRNPEDLIPSNENFYDTEKIAKLKESIKLLGLLQPLLIENRDGKDYIIAGHSRRKCCLELIEQGEERFRKVPCVYRPKTDLDTGDQDEIIRKIMIIQSNTYREKTDWEKMTEALQMEELVKELRKNVELEGKTRDITAHLIGASSSQIGRYRSIDTNLSDSLMAEFKKNHINLSTAAELAGLKPEYQHQAYEIFQREGNISINDAKVLKARQEQEDLPGQMTIEQALHPTKSQEVATVIPVNTQIDRFFEALRKSVSAYILQNNLNMTIYMLSALYGSVRVRNGHLNYQGQKEGILFNGGSNEEQLVTWNNFSTELIRRYGKKQKQVKMASVVEEEHKLTDAEAVRAFCEAYPEDLRNIMKICRKYKNNGDAAKEVQEKFTLCGLNALYGTGKVDYEFRSFSNGLKIIIGRESVHISYGMFVTIIKRFYNPLSPEFDDPEEKTGKCIHRPECDCTLSEAQKLATGDGEGCNEKCCWNCEKHSSCGYECNSSAHRPDSNMPGLAKCITGQSGSGQCGAAAYCDEKYNCCAQCPDDCNSRCGWIESCQPAAEAPDEKQHDFVEPNEIEEHIVEDNKTSDHAGDPAEMLPENWPEFLKDIPTPTDTEITCYLYDQERDLKQILEIERTEPGPGLPHMTVVQQQMVVAGLRLLQDLIENSKQPEQPPLPEMKNNDQRKEWLRNYKSWGLWYTDHHTGVRYYKYDFQNGARLIAEEYDPEPQKSSWWVPTESCYMHLVGGPEPASKDKIPKWTYHEKYNRFPNSETELVEFLKEVQK